MIPSIRDQTCIARGLGRSYGDAALNRDAAVVSMLRLDRILGFDSASGVLECEGGVSLDKIIPYALPRGFFLPVTPGTQRVTVGGAIAADIHGKNHHQAGTFSNFVVELDLLTGEAERLTCSREVRPDFFWATVGGMGLTGFILRARLQLQRVDSAYLQVQLEKVHNLSEALAVLEAGDRQHEYSAAWVDCASGANQLGRCVVMFGRHAKASEIGARSPLALRDPRRWSVPVVPLISPLRRWTVSVYNAAYFGLKSAGPRLMDLDQFFYPLDSVEDWNRLYGRRGFVQYQVAAPHPAAPSLFSSLLRTIRQSGRAAFLGVLKRFGPEGAGLLSFPLEGATLALDLPFDRGLPGFLRGLDERVVEHGGRVYLAKDAVLSPEMLERMYPKLDQFRQVQRRLDPRGRISSSLARRLRIVDA